MRLKLQIEKTASFLYATKEKALLITYHLFAISCLHSFEFLIQMGSTQKKKTAAEAC